MGLQGKLALVTGSARGLGRMAAVALAEQGCDVVVNYVRSAAAADELVAALRKSGVRAAAIRADMSVPAEVAGLVEAVRAEMGGLPDIVVNNAGPFIRERRCFADYTLEEIHGLIHGNLLGVMLLDHAVLPHMRSQRWGRIIHFGFAHAGEARGWPHRAVYAAAKVGLVSFTKTLAVEEAEYGITVNMICPGDVRGDNKEKTIAQVRDLVDEEAPRGRPGSGEDITRVITFLCDEASDYITGNVINITGGLDPIRTLPLRRS
jgi:3-oxoacyl-[acyl-carrier protein] reductase